MTSFLAQALSETLWPTRCVLCDAPGSVLCPACERRLRFIDFYQACPRCGAAWGRIQCETCNPVAADSKPDTGLCLSCLPFDEQAASIVKTYKDKGEQRLAGVMARMRADITWPSWKTWAQGVTFIPATPAAVKRRGFDHAALLAGAYAARIGVPCIPLIAQAQTADQRELGRVERRANIEGRFRAPRAAGFRQVVVIDDVLTTGATLAGARKALARQGCDARCVTFARV